MKLQDLQEARYTDSDPDIDRINTSMRMGRDEVDEWETDKSIKQLVDTISSHFGKPKYNQKLDGGDAVVTWRISDQLTITATTYLTHNPDGSTIIVNKADSVLPFG